MDTRVKPFLIATMLPLCVTMVASHFLTMSFLSLDVSWVTRIVWLIPDLLLVTAHGALCVLTLLLTARRELTSKVAFVFCLLLTLSITSLELTAINFAHVTGSQLDGAMLLYAFQNAEESWALINDSTPGALQLLMGVVAIVALSLPFVLQKKLSPWRHDAARTQRRVALLATSTLLLFLVAAVASDREYDAAFPNVVHIVSSELRAPLGTPGTASALGYDTRQATLRRVEKSARPRNVVLILLESTRASATTPYNPDLPTTPFLHELSQKSIMAEHAYAVMPHTSKAVVTTGCGVHPYLGLPILEKSEAGIPANCLAKLFRGAGYATAFFQSATETFEGRKQVVENMGFEDFFPLEKLDAEGFEKANYFGPEDDVMLAPSVEWATRHHDKPFFLTYLTVTPHHGYDAPRRYGRHDFSKKGTYNRYLNSVHYVDNFVKNVIEEFKKNGMYEDTVFAIVGDHGEGFGEHKRNQHDKLLYDEGLRVPLIIHDPRNPSPRKISAPVSQLDLAPTLIELSRHELIQGAMPGLSLLHDIPEDRTLYSDCWAKDYCIGMIKGRMKYIHHYGRIQDEVLDLDADPAEKKPVARTLPGDTLKEIIDWKASVNQLYEHNHARYSQALITTDPPEMQTLRDEEVSFGDNIVLLGYDVDPDPEALTTSTPVTLTLYFKVLEDVEESKEGEWRLFVHGIDAKGKMRNYDHVPVEGTLPVGKFEAGTYIIDRHTFFLKKKTAPGKFHFNVGFWNTSTKKRMKARIGDKKLAKDIYKIRDLKVID